MKTTTTMPLWRIGRNANVSIRDQLINCLQKSGHVAMVVGEENDVIKWRLLTDILTGITAKPIRTIFVLGGLLMLAGASEGEGTQTVAVPPPRSCSCQPDMGVIKRCLKRGCR